MIASCVIALAWATFAVPCLANPDQWIQAGTGSAKMCAGVKTSCTSVQTCTYHAYGPCGGNMQPNIYIEGEIAGMALIKNQATYLTDAAQMEVLSPSTSANNGYKKLEDTASTSTGTYAFIQAGAFYGTDPSVSGGFIGMAAYVAKTGSIKTKMNDVFVPTLGQARDTVTAKSVCISDLTAGACGAERTFNAGDYKFSLFGRTLGSNFNVDATVTHLGIRTKMTLKGTNANLMLNGDKTLDNIGATDVTELTLTETGGAERKLTIDFPTKYNVGDTTDAGLSTPSATKTVKIKVSPVASGSQSIYIDYLFEVLTVKDKYFIYDPTVKDTGSGASGTTAGANKMSLPLPLVVAFVANLLCPGNNQAA